MGADVRELTDVTFPILQTFLKEDQVRIEEAEGSVDKNKDNSTLKHFFQAGSNMVLPLIFYINTFSLIKTHCSSGCNFPFISYPK